MTAALAPEFALTDDELQAAAGRIGVQSLPAVLAVRPRHATVDVLDAALDRATRSLASRGLIENGVVDPDLGSMLTVLHRPDRELAMRFVTPDGIARVAVVRRGSLCVLARRIGQRIDIRMVGVSLDERGAVTELLSELPRSGGAAITPVGAPLAAMSEQLCGSHDATTLADRVRALGAEPQAALLLGSALAARQAFAEIVYYALAEHEGRIVRAPAAVAVFYTKRGRVVGAPSRSPAGQLWTTLKPGSDHAVIQAVGQLIELSGERWGDS